MAQTSRLHSRRLVAAKTRTWQTEKVAGVKPATLYSLVGSAGSPDERENLQSRFVGINSRLVQEVLRIHLADFILLI